MDWTEVVVNIPVEFSDTAAAIANMTVPYGIYIEDYSDLEQGAQEIAHINLIDEALIAKDRKTAKIHIYIPETENAMEAISFLKERYNAENIPCQVDSETVNDSDWNENWKKYFFATEIGSKLAICPSWEKYDNKEGRVVLSIDPGAAFGTGTHATTSLCLNVLENYVKAGDKVLDVGCGSGILAIAAALLGAENCLGVDIDTQAVKVAKENALINSVQDRVVFEKGDLTKTVSGKYNIVCANIVADAIMFLSGSIKPFLEKNAIYIVSGIIDIRAQEVKDCLLRLGFKIIEEHIKDNWYAFVLKEN